MDAGRHGQLITSVLTAPAVTVAAGVVRFGMIFFDHSSESFNELIDAIMGQGFDEETAAHFASLIGDLPQIDEQGNVVVMEDGQVLARLKLDLDED